jgi:hypothetical protein
MTKFPVRTFKYRGVNSHDRNPTVAVLENKRNTLIGINLFYLSEKDRNYVLTSRSKKWETLAKNCPSVKKAVRTYNKQYIVR